jgi:PHD/YefM family antitoxin component YafN of YafNO toxin-antitoxin module
MRKLLNIISVSDLRQDAAKVLKQLRNNKEPVVVTQRGAGGCRNNQCRGV